jgi:hypothetical protein
LADTLRLPERPKASLLPAQRLEAGRDASSIFVVLVTTLMTISLGPRARPKTSVSASPTSIPICKVHLPACRMMKWVLIDSLDSAREIQADRAYLRRRQFKRRKMDYDNDDNSEEPLSGFHAFNYGHFGQVDEGSLRMDIVSCDGGEFSRDPAALHGTTYRPENVLADDRSVYCTKGSSCNLMLRHVGESSFTLKRIIVRAPHIGFTAPYVSPITIKLDLANLFPAYNKVSSLSATTQQSCLPARVHITFAMPSLTAKPGHPALRPTGIASA